MIITVKFLFKAFDLVNKRVIICVVCPIAIQFFIVNFLQLGAKVEWATSKNDAFQILGSLDFRFPV